TSCSPCGAAARASPLADPQELRIVCPMEASHVTLHVVTAENVHLLDRVAPGVFDHEVRPELLSEFLANPMNHIVVAVSGGTVVGMATGISYVHPDKPLQLLVNEGGAADAYRRQGTRRRRGDRLLAPRARTGC